MIRPTALILATAAGLSAQQPVSSGAFITRLGNDTISVERFTRTATRLEGDLVRRSPTTHIIHYVFTMRPDGQIASAQLTTRKVDGTVTATTSPAVGADTVVALPDGYAPYELWLWRLRMQRRDSADIVSITPLGGAGGRMPVRMLRGDSVRAWFFGSPLRIRADGSGRLLGLDGRMTTLKYEVTRLPTIDINAVATGFADRDAAGGAFGALASKRDTLRAQIGAANIWVDYGRPLTRGRDVFTSGVLGDTLWRTGANAATQFRTDKDLLVGGQRLKAGTYSLWTRVSPDNSTYSLLFNSQSGQWGTEHHSDRDVLAVPLRASRSPFTEAFTILVDATSPASMFTLAWGTLRLSTRIEGAP